MSEDSREQGPRREDVRDSQIQYQLLNAMMEIGKEWDSPEDAPLHIPPALEHIQTAMNLLSNPETTVSEAQPADPEWPVTFRHKNPELSRAPPINREMVAWSYDVIKTLFEGNTDYALLCQEADYRAVFFWEDGEFWLFCDNPAESWSQAYPETITDWIGSEGIKEPGAEPLLVHRDEMNGDWWHPVASVAAGDVDHIHETEVGADA